MSISPKRTYLAGMLMLSLLLSSSAMARNWRWHRTKASAAVQSQEDSAEKQPAQEPPAGEQPAQNQPAQTAPDAQKPSPEKPAETPQAQEPSKDKQPDKQPPAESNQPAPGTNAPNSGQSNSAQPTSPQPSSDSTTQPKAPSSSTPQNPAAGAPGEAATVSTEQPRESAASKGNHRKHKNSSPKRTKVIVREGGLTETSALLSPSLTVEQASSQIQKTTQLLASAEANLQKISARKLNPDQQATVNQIHTYVQQAKEALNRSDLQRGHNLALKANLLADDLARH